MVLLALSIVYYPPANVPDDGQNGGTVYDAQGVDTDIYFSGSTPSANYPTADGYMLAPNGGDGGFNYFQVGPNAFLGGSGGDGGNGRLPGTGGAVGAVGDVSYAGDGANRLYKRHWNRMGARWC